MAVTIDGSNKLITLESLVTSKDAKVIYSEWKDWVKAGDNAKYLPAFDTIGGDDLDGGTTAAGDYYFFRNDSGWRIKPPEEDIEIIINGNLFPRDALTPWRIGTVGAFNTSVDRTVSSNTQTITTAGGSGLDATQDSNLTAIYNKIVQLVFTKANELDVNVQSMNDAELLGSGTDLDKWRGQ